MKQIFILFLTGLLFSCSSNTDSGTSTPANPGSGNPGGKNEIAASPAQENSTGTETSAPANITPSSTEFILSGKIANAVSQPVILERYSLLQNQQTLGSATISGDGSFTFKGQITEKGLYLIRLNNNINWLVVLDAGNYNFNADASNIYKYTIDGSPESQSFAAFIVKAGENQATLNQINNQYNIARARGQMQEMIFAQQQYQEKYAAHQNYLRSVMDTSKYPLTAVFAASLLNAED
ncbi:MAG TPA: DUF4369 domain-containing protein, partial [Chitinophagales bacterium]|nr:DUF4369 domain-containing protein [Chitinophagales bacterium]